MNQKQKARSALTAVFPNKNAIADFIKDSEDRKRLQSFVDFAANHGLINTPTHAAFKAFIDANSRPQFNADLDDLTMEELIDNRKKYLNTRLSNSALTDKINALLANNAIDLPPLSSAMLTRFKSQAATTPHRRDALRCFAFWIGYERSDLGGAWHYEALKELCRHSDNRKSNNSCGVRIAFSINSRGNIIGQDIITWLKRTIREALIKRTDLFSGGNPPKLKNYDVMTFQMDLPNTDQNAIPSAYANTLKEAVTIAHHMAIQWLMSGFSTYNRFFFIGIAAGEFDKINNQLQAIVNAKLPEDPIIRMTDYARQCAMISQIKIIVNHNPIEIELVSGEAFKAWWITELSGMIYWNLIPNIISKNEAEKLSFTAIDIMRQLMIPGDENFFKGKDATICFFKFPQHPMLGFEIIRALICKNKITEALEILNALLRVTPNHLNSRITRMTLFKFIGVKAPSYDLAEMVFAMAEEEAAYIIENFNYAGEDFYYEYTLLKLARFSKTIQMLRKTNKDEPEGAAPGPSVSDLFPLADQAEKLIMKGMINSSPTLERITYLFLSVQLLKYILPENLKDDGRINQRLTYPNNKIKMHMADLFVTLWYPASSLGNTEVDTTLEIFNEVVKRDDAMIALEAFKPAQFFIRAVFYWDILPIRNVHTIKETLKLLEIAIELASVHLMRNEPVYSMASLSGQFVSADQFISQVESIVKEIEQRYGKRSELEKLDPAAVIGRADDDLVLMTYHV